MRAAIVAAVLMMTGPVAAQSVDWRGVDECYRRSAAELDDMASDAETIGKAVSFTCLNAERQFARTGRAESETTQAHIDLRSTFLARATTAVLIRRVMIRKGEIKP